MHHKIVSQYSYSKIGILFLLIVAASCSTKKIVNMPPFEIKPLEKEVFVSKPFGYNPTIKNFKMYLPSSFKLQIYSMKNIHNPAITDTIYKFHQNKSELLIYKTLNNKELFFAATVFSNKIQFQNGVKVGISRNDFFKCFVNLKQNMQDTIQISSKSAVNKVSFIFKGNKLNAITINNYID